MSSIESVASVSTSCSTPFAGSASTGATLNFRLLVFLPQTLVASFDLLLLISTVGCPCIHNSGSLASKSRKCVFQCHRAVLMRSTHAYFPTKSPAFRIRMLVVIRSFGVSVDGFLFSCFHEHI